MLSKTLCLAVSIQLVVAFNHDRTLVEKSPDFHRDWDKTDVKYLLHRNKRDAKDLSESLIDEIFEMPEVGELKQAAAPAKRQAIMIPMPDLPPGVVNFYQNTFVPNGNQINYYLSQMTPLGWAQQVGGAFVHLPFIIPIFYCIYPPKTNNSVSIDNRFLFPDDPILNTLGGQGPVIRPTTTTPPPPEPPVVEEQPSGYPERVTDTPTGISLVAARPNRPMSIVPPPLRHNASASGTQAQSNSEPAIYRGGSNSNRVYPLDAPAAIARPAARPQARPAFIPTTQAPFNNRDCATAIRYCCSQYAPGSSRDYCLTSRGCGAPVWSDDGDICDRIG